MENCGLDNRLLAVASQVRKGSVFADVGTDHGYIPVYLVKKGICQKGFASDINEMPLEKAKMNIKGHGFENRITTLLCDGLEDLQKGGAQDIIIAGMGGDMISHIIGNAKWLEDKEVHLVLQPMTKTEKLRKYLYKNGYEIIKEKAVESGRFLYTVISAKYSGEKADIEDELLYFGKMLDEKDAVATKYLEHIIATLKTKANGQLKSKPSEEKGKKTLEIIKKLETAMEKRKENIDDYGRANM